MLQLPFAAEENGDSTDTNFFDQLWLKRIELGKQSDIHHESVVDIGNNVFRTVRSIPFRKAVE